MTAIARHIFDKAFAFLTPYRCRSCGGALFDHANPYLCSACLAAMQWIGPGACEGCGFPAGPGAVHRQDCFRCRDGKLRLTGAAAVARYRGGAKSLVKAFKFRGETGLEPLLSGLMAERLRTSHFWGKVNLVLPVALHDKRRRWRGFDQALLLARAVAAQTGLPLRADALRRIRPTPPQAMLRRAERLRNLAGAFQVNGSLAGAKVLLIDDVMTTGTTMAECARACREAGASRVYALTFAR